MKPLVPILLLSLALLPLSARADARKAQFMQSLAVPLSRTESRQLESLLKADKTATDAYDKSSKACSAANTAMDKATPGEAATLKIKVAALSKKQDADLERYSVVNGTLETFESSKRARMPLAVRRTFPARATTLYLGRHAVGKMNQPTLFHLWTTSPRANSNFAYDNAPFHLDVFQMARGNRAHGWRRVATALYTGSSVPNPDGVSVRYLHASTKQSPVLVMVSPAYISTLYTVVTFPHGFKMGKNQSFVQDFYQGGVGGGKSVYDFGVDRRGMMTVVNKGWFGGGPTTTTVLAWNGREYARPVGK